MDSGPCGRSECNRNTHCRSGTAYAKGICSQGSAGRFGWESDGNHECDETNAGEDLTPATLSRFPSEAAELAEKPSRPYEHSTNFSHAEVDEMQYMRHVFNCRTTPRGVIATIAIWSLTCLATIGQEIELPTGQDRFEATLMDLQSRMEALEVQNSELKTQLSQFEEAAGEALKSEKWGREEARKNEPKYRATYNKGFVFEPVDPKKTPFELRVNGRMQFRYTGFDRDRKSYPTLAGTVPVETRNDFEIERGRLEFSGFMWDPKLQFYINIDADTDDQHRAIFHDFWVNYKFDDAFNLHAGKAFVPGSRDWLSGSTRTHLADRSMANSFFRPDRSIGIWAEGEIADGVFYRAMLANGFNTQDLRASTVPHEIDSLFAYSATSYWDPFGDYGKGYADIDCSCDFLARIGHSFTYAPNHGQDGHVGTRAEEAAIRLSDGSLLTATGVLGPGAQVRDFDVYLYAVDAAFKYRGWSMNSEYYFRWIQDMRANAPISTSKLYDDGFYVDLGKMIIAKKVELVGRVSTVDGAFGDTWEYAGGTNVYLNGDHSHKVTLDASVLDGSPTSASSPNYEVGQDGVLYRLQYQVAF